MNRQTIRVLLGIFLIRLLLALLPSFQVDMGAWLAWARRLAAGGFANFYSDAVWTQYTPGYLYWLWLIGKLGMINPLAIKIPVIIADMITAGLIWKIIAKQNKKIANWSYVLYVLNPVMIMDGSIWGQIDGILTLAMMLSSYYLIEKERTGVAWGMMGIALLIKPQALAILPVLLVLTLGRVGMRKLVKAGLIMAGVLIVGYWQFFPSNPVTGMLTLMQKMGESYSYTSLFAFNVWSYVGLWIADNAEWLGLTYFQWGVLMMGGAYLAIFIRYGRKLKDNAVAYLLLAAGCLIFFLFPTRVHERYLFPMFAFLITYAGLTKHKQVGMMLTVMTVSYSLNLYLPYSYYEQASNGLKNLQLEQWIMSWQKIWAGVPITLFGWMLLAPGRKELEESIPKMRGKRKAVEHGGD